MSDIAVSVKGVKKSFKLPNESYSSIKLKFINMFKRDYKKGYTNYEALKGIDLEVKKGDFFGIVGRNGAGKSTLLKIIAEIYKPDSGSVKVNGKLVPFIELGVGFNPNLSGHDNVYLNCAMLGFSRKETDAMYDSIVEFAELKEFMNQKLKNYSSGMKVRLAFSVAIQANADILLLDEVLAVGDEAFQRKCNDYFYDQKKNKKTIILVTHNMNAVREFCNKAVMIENGKVLISGNPDRVASQYSKIFRDELSRKRAKEKDNIKQKIGSDEVKLKSINVLQNGKVSKVINFKEDFSVEVVISAKKDYSNLVMGLPIVDRAGKSIVSLSTLSLKQFDLKGGDTKITYRVQNILNDGDYYFNIAIGYFGDNRECILKEQEVCKFTILGIDETKFSKYGVTHPDFEVEVL